MSDAPALLDADALKAQALAFGLAIAAITPAQPAETLPAYEAWVEAGMHGEMGYLARPDRLARRRDLEVILPGARSLLLVALHYDPSLVPQSILTDPARGRISSYAWGRDYHHVMGERLALLAGWVEAQGAGVRAYVDTGAILERAHAHASGLGFVGKNTLLIHPQRGSFFFLGELIMTAAVDVYDAPFPKATMCGSCTRCLDACPTHAFPNPHTLDARLCISYLTIEYKGWIPRALRPRMGNWIYGCDICQQVCPWNRFAAPSEIPEFAPPDIEDAAPALLGLLQLDDGAFRERYAESPIRRIGRDRLVRNGCIAAGNWGDPEALPALAALLDDGAALVRGHAAWAVGRIGADAGSRGAAMQLLERAHAHETDPLVVNEIADALEFSTVSP